MKMLNLIGFGEHAGSGVPDIFETWESAGLSEPVVEECFGENSPSKTIVTLPLVKKNLVLFEKGPEKGPEKRPKNNEVAARNKAVLKLIRENPYISRAEIGLKLGITDKQVRLSLERLKRDKQIYREGSNRGGYWIVDNYSKDGES